MGFISLIRFFSYGLPKNGVSNGIVFIMKKIIGPLLLFFYIAGATQAQVCPENYVLLPNSRSIKTADVNNDGFIDVIVGRLNSQDNDVIFSVFLNDGNGHLEGIENISSPKPNMHMCYEMTLLSFCMEDFDGDGSLDIASYAYSLYGNMYGSSDYDTCFIRVDHNDGNGRFHHHTETVMIQPEEVWYNGYPYHLDNPYYLVMISGDFNGDSFPDLAIANDYHANSLSGFGYACNDGTGGFNTIFSLGTMRIPQIGDLNKDGKDEIIDGAGIFYPSDSLIPQFENLHPYIYDGYLANGVAVLDIDGDGFHDIVEGRSAEDSHIWVFKNIGGEAFQKMDSIEFFGRITGYDIVPDNMKIMNYNGDEYPDIIVQMGDSWTHYFGYYVYEGNGGFEFNNPVLFYLEEENNEYIRNFDIGDLNNDGFDDLVVIQASRSGESRLVVFQNNGNGFTSIHEPDNYSPVTCFPNPTTNYVHIIGIEVGEIKVYNILGQLIKSQQGLNEINLEGLAEGVYLLQMTSVGGKLFTEHITIVK